MHRLSWSLLLICTLSALPAQDAGGLHVIKTGWLFDGLKSRGASHVHVKDGKIVAITAAGMPVPAGAKVTDLGPDSHLMPGLVLAHNSTLMAMPPAVDSLTPGVRSSDAWDPFVDRKRLAKNGITTYVLSPGAQRFLPGHASAVRPHVARDAQVLHPDPALTFVVTRAAYNPPSVYTAPVPPGPDNPNQVADKRFPRSRAGALTALRRLMEASRGAADMVDLESGDVDLRPLRPLLSGDKILRVRAELAADIRGVARVAEDHGLKLVIVGGTEAWKVADRLGRIGAGVILRAGASPFVSGPAPEGWPRPDGDPHPDAAGVLSKAGVEVALVPTDPNGLNDLMWFAAQTVQDGYSREHVLRALTGTAAKLAGLEGVGRIVGQAHADLVAFDRHPLAAGASPTMVMSGGEVVHGDASDAPRRMLVRARRVKTNDGEDLVPGEVLIEDGVIVAVGRSLVAPPNTKVVEANVVVPGFVDLGAQVGVRRYSEDQNGVVSLTAPVGPIATNEALLDVFDRDLPDVAAAARAGVTSLALTPRGARGIGGLLSVIKTAGPEDTSVVAREGGIFVDFAGASTNDVGKLKKAIESAKKYRESWESYEKKLAEYEAEQKKAAEEAKKEAAKKATIGRDEKVDPVARGTAFHPYHGVWEGRITGLGDGDAGRGVNMVLRPGRRGMTAQIEVSALRPYRMRGQARVEKGELVVGAEFGQQRFAARLVVFRDELRGRWTSGNREGFIHVTRTSRELPPRQRRGEAEGEGSEKPAEPDEEKKPEEASAEPEKKEAEKKAADDKADDKAPKKPKKDAAQEVWASVLDSEAPVVVHVSSTSVAKAVLDLCRDDHDLRTVIVGRAVPSGLLDAVADNDAAMGAGPAVLRRTGDDDGLPLVDAIARGVPTALWSGPDGDPRTLYRSASYAVHRGLDRTQALRMISLYPALVLGVEDRVGRIKKGAHADLVFLSGEPFQPATRIARVLVGGSFVEGSER